MACISGSRADVLIIQLAAAFARVQQLMLGVKPQFSAISFQEVSERPSTYFFTVLPLFFPSCYVFIQLQGESLSIESY